MNYPNEVIHTEWGYISYNPDVSRDPRAKVMDAFLCAARGREQHSTEETAICTQGKYYILEGDWRDVLRGKALEECLNVFRQNSQFHACSTHDLEEPFQ